MPASAPIPLFDHVFAVVDATTLAAVNDCDFLREERLGRFASHASQNSVLGAYQPTRIMGRNTFVELFPDRFGEGRWAPVRVGLVFSFVHAGDRLAARAALERAGVGYDAELVRRQVSGEDLPFYHATRPDVGDASPLALFLSELTPEYCTAIGARAGADGCHDRSAYLEASLGRSHDQACLLEDIEAVRLRLRPQRAARLAQTLGALGYEVSASGSTVRGPQITLEIEAADAGPEGLLEAGMRLAASSSTQQPPLDFGPRSSLTFSPDARAVWRFEPPAPG